MQDVMTMLETLHRPRLLMRAARIGAKDYRRDVHLQRLLNAAIPSRGSEVLLRLVELEDSLNDQRLSDETGYNMLRHIDLLIAIVAEARQLRTTLMEAA